MQSLMASNATLAGARGSYAAAGKNLRRSAKLGARRQVNMGVRAAKTPDGPVLAIAGVSGAVGQEFLQVRAPLLALLRPNRAIPHRMNRVVKIQHGWLPIFSERTRTSPMCWNGVPWVP